MVGVSTVALIERRPDISRSLFSRYWRDVHGVMAARIPGFDTYTQYHVSRTATDLEPFEGIAIVTFRSEEDRSGLIHSEVTQHIHRDEQNVFRRALLYNLSASADKVLIGTPEVAGTPMFVVLPASQDPEPTLFRLGAGAGYLATYDLTGGDPAAWNGTDQGEGVFGLLIHGIWPTDAAAQSALDAQGGYAVNESHVMVERGKTTPVGLRGLDAVRTIAEAGADNQLSDDVVRAIYGVAAAP